MAPLDGRWAPSRYHKELQRAIAFRSYISILRSGVRKKQTQESILERLFHKGETNEHGEQIQGPLVDQAIKGAGQFCGLCDRHSYISIDGGTGERKEEVRLVVQDCFTRTLSVRFVIGESFTRESLSMAKLSDNKKLVSGRTLRAGAEVAHRNGKKAYEYAMDFLDENMELPANKTVDDYDTYILTMMWKDQKQSRSVPTDQEDQVSNANEIGVPPTDWIFDGWFAFRLYGPIVDETMLEYKTDAFADPPDVMHDDDDEEDGKVKADPAVTYHLSATPTTTGATTPAHSRKRMTKLPPGPFPPHLSEEEKRHVLNVVLQRVDTRERMLQAEILSLQKKAESIGKTMEMELKIALAVASEDPNHESWREYRVLQRELTQIWTDIEQKHKENKTRDAYECEVVNEYLSAVTYKRFRFDPKPA
ncbi:hypothetical protein ACA910_001655 [Epithemia clementina (nom. ined.)]